MRRLLLVICILMAFSCKSVTDNLTGEKKGGGGRAVSGNTEDAVINAGVYDNRGRMKYAEGDYAGAIMEYTKAIEMNPEFADAYNNRGISKACRGDYDDAISDFSRAAVIDPEFFQAYINRGLARLYKNDFDGAVSDFNKAIEINPGISEAYNNRACAYRALKKFDLAVSDAEKSVFLSPEDYHPYSTLSEIYGDMDNDEGFFKYLELAMQKGFQPAKLIDNAEYSIYKKYENRERFKELMKKYE